MQQVTRSLYLFFCIEDTPALDIAALLRGTLEVLTTSHISALVLSSGERYEISHADFRFLSALSAQTWTPVSELIDASDKGKSLDLEGLLRRGLLLVQGEGPLLPGPMQEREQLLRRYQWDSSAALYHFMGREKEGEQFASAPTDVSVLAKAAETDASNFVRRHGPPPEAFYRVENIDAAISLPLIEKKSELYETLQNRKTVRAFDSERVLELRDLAILLRYTFGCHGYAQLDEDVVLLHKTSPSGGSLHPIEAYPLILNVESLAPGIYHYSIKDHSLELVEEMSNQHARRLAVDFSNGQLYAETAHALVILTARFFRNQWKYRRRSRTYGVMLMDAGHLSQTFYLVATNLGLGAFYTAAINGPLIEKKIGVRAPEEGAIGICGCGIKASGSPDLGLEFRPFIPRKTKI